MLDKGSVAGGHYGNLQVSIIYILTRCHDVLLLVAGFMMDRYVYDILGRGLVVASNQKVGAHSLQLVLPMAGYGWLASHPMGVACEISARFG